MSDTGNPWPKWLWQKYEVVTSPSALTDWLACPRRWWFRKVVKMPELQRQGKFDFGNALHGVVERWLLADETGRGEDGQPVDLYPEGWDQHISKADAQLIKVQVKKAIAEGILRRHPGRQIEEPMIREITPHVAMIGKLDVSSAEGVEDHKTTKSRRYISTVDELASDDKMLCYGMEKVLREETDGEQVVLRLNYFSKDPSDPFVKPVEVSVPQDEIVAWWDRTVVPAAEGMLELKRQRIKREEWTKVPGPTRHNACRDYGGCPFAEVCGRVKSVDAYSRTIDRLNQPKPSPADKAKGSTVSIFDRKKPAGGKSSASPKKPPTPPPEPPPEVQDAAPPPTPWAVDGCRVCGGTGINSKNEPCGACGKIQARKGGKTPEDFLIDYDDDGNLTWREKGGDEKGSAGKVEVVGEPDAKPARAARKSRVPKEKPKATKPKVEAPPPSEDEAVEASVADFDQTVASADEAPVVGPIIYVNAMPQNSEYVPFVELFEREAEELAQASNVESFYDLDTWQRKSDLAKHAKTVAEQHSGECIVAVGIASQDMKSYLDALLPHAAEVIRGVF